ncbi:MAG TPA: transglycosylase SLT domain-containing protein [Candidatus Binataceae bacterium]|nr:transglycosylase SLT domain-containing protein [Candidatus Binataceae bacterium]
MSFWPRLGVVVIMAVALAAAAAVSARAFALGPARAGRAFANSPRALLAQFGSLTVVPIDPEKAFVEGYRAYRGHDYLKAIERMTLAASKVPTLADYALYYLGAAQRDSGDKQAAAITFGRLRDSYPQSVFAADAALEYARIELDLGHFAAARQAAAALVARNPGAGVEQQARMVEAQATLAAGDAGAAYVQLQALREKFPRGAVDAAARALAYSIIASHPVIVNTHSFDYHRGEAALLLREGQAAMALKQIQAALRLEPTAPVRAELTWMEAHALRARPEHEAQALRAYLKLAPGGPRAAQALYRLGHLEWRRGDTEAARTMFSRLARSFPGSTLAPDAMFDIGRTREDDGDWDLARAAYLRLARIYPHSSSAAEGRFRAPFALYMSGRFAEAAAEFAAMRPHAESAADRDMFSYWHARALERAGRADEARQIYARLAQGAATNYYPALAARRLAAAPAPPTVPDQADPAALEVPQSFGPAQFHLGRLATLRRLGLIELEPPELRALAAQGLGDPRVRLFVLLEFQRTGAWYDAIETATRLEKYGGLDPALGERLRYPRAYWGLIAPAAERASLDPCLVLALVRQESLFNPQARSVSDARGLMQLMAATAARVGPSAGVVPASLDLYDPALSVRIGTTYLKDLFEMFGGDPFRAVAAYNAGEHAVQGWNAKFPGDDDQWVENIGYRETREYVKKVIGGLREYQILYPSNASSPAQRPQRPA